MDIRGRFLWVNHAIKARLQGSGARVREREHTRPICRRGADRSETRYQIWRSLDRDGSVWIRLPANNESGVVAHDRCNHRHRRGNDNRAGHSRSAMGRAEVGKGACNTERM